MQTVPQFWFDQVLIPKLLVPPPSNFVSVLEGLCLQNHLECMTFLQHIKDKNVIFVLFCFLKKKKRMIPGDRMSMNVLL